MNATYISNLQEAALFLFAGMRRVVRCVLNLIWGGREKAIDPSEEPKLPRRRVRASLREREGFSYSPQDSEERAHAAAIADVSVDNVARGELRDEPVAVEREREGLRAGADPDTRRLVLAEELGRVRALEDDRAPDAGRLERVDMDGVHASTAARERVTQAERRERVDELGFLERPYDRADELEIRREVLGEALRREHAQEHQLEPVHQFGRAERKRRVGVPGKRRVHVEEGSAVARALGFRQRRPADRLRCRGFVHADRKVFPLRFRHARSDFGDADLWITSSFCNKVVKESVKKRRQQEAV